jgi:hypothetical protein
METNSQFTSAPVTLPPDVDPQGIIGSFLGKFAGGFVGKHLGGQTGSTIGSIAGGALGSILPFSAGPNTAQPVSDMELQSFWSTFQKIAGTVAKGAQTAVNVGHGLGLFEATPAAPAPQQVSDMELQSFWSTFQKIAGTVAKGAQTGLNIGRGLGLLQAGPDASGERAAPVSEMEMQNFLNVFTKVAGMATSLGATAAPSRPAQASGLTSDQAMNILRQVSPVLQTLLQRPNSAMN